MHKGTKVVLTDVSRIRAIEAQYPNWRLRRLVVGSKGTVVASRSKIDDMLLIKFVGYGSVLAIKTTSVERV